MEHGLTVGGKPCILRVARQNREWLAAFGSWCSGCRKQRNREQRLGQDVPRAQIDLQFAWPADRDIGDDFAPRRIVYRAPSAGPRNKPLAQIVRRIAIGDSIQAKAERHPVVAADKGGDGALESPPFRSERCAFDEQPLRQAPRAAGGYVVQARAIETKSRMLNADTYERMSPGNLRRHF